MKPASIALALLALGWPVLRAGATDLRNIDRTIAKEPKYTSQPYYALLVFGAQAKTHIWLVLDGPVLYVDRNGNGDLTEPFERIEPDVEAAKRIEIAPGEYKKPNVFNIGQLGGEQRLRLEVWIRDESYVPPANEPEVLREFRAERKLNGWEQATLYRVGADGIQAQIPVTLCRTAKDAQVSHLRGPLTFALRSGQALQRSSENFFDVRIGTPGIATRNSRYPVLAPLTTSEVPADLHPLAMLSSVTKTRANRLSSLRWRWIGAAEGTPSMAPCGSRPKQPRAKPKSSSPSRTG